MPQEAHEIGQLTMHTLQILLHTRNKLLKLGIRLSPNPPQKSNQWKSDNPEANCKRGTRLVVKADDLPCVDFFRRLRDRGELNTKQRRRTRSFRSQRITAMLIMRSPRSMQQYHDIRLLTRNLEISCLPRVPHSALAAHTLDSLFTSFHCIVSGGNCIVHRMWPSLQ